MSELVNAKAHAWVRKSVGATFRFLVLGSFLVGCATMKKQDSTTSDDGKSASVGMTKSGDEVVTPVKDLDSFRLSEVEGPKQVVEELETIPVEINPLVEKWISYFQGRGRPHMERYLSRSARYEKLMKKVLRDNGLPEDLFYIALIESGFSSSAISHAAAVGYWQFIRGTGKRYGLTINQMVDERRDPVLATQAAAEYFKGLYSVFGSWYLSMASYNVGENRVKKETVKMNTHDFWELARKKRLPMETINYVPKFIAAKLIAKDPAKYGFDGLDYLPPIEFDHITVKTPVNLRMMAEKLNIPYEDFKALNPKFKGEVAPLRGSDLVIRIVPGTEAQALIAATESATDKAEFVADSGDTQLYKVRAGESLHTIARKFRTTVAYLRDLNDLPRKKRLKVGSKIYVPDRTPTRERKDRTAGSSGGNKTRFETTKAQRTHVVRAGDSLLSIARANKVSVDALLQVNHLRHGQMLQKGSRLQIPSTIGVAGSKKQFHVVRRGETLERIAAKYNVSVHEIRSSNKIKAASRVLVGARLMIPEAEAAE